jgi:hypothetical protein
MRERAESIGAGFKIMSRAEAGTEVELTVPGNVAFERELGTRPGRVTGLYRRMVGEREPGPTEKES